MRQRSGGRRTVTTGWAAAVMLVLGGCATLPVPWRPVAEPARIEPIAGALPLALPPAPPPPLIGAIPKRKPARSAAAAAPARPTEPLLWPVHGPVVRGFGPQGGGIRSDGLDIAASEGTLVIAAASGVVSFAGADLAGYGNLLLIEHPGGYTTVYAYNRRLLVGAGEPVRRGQPVAVVGSDSSDEPLLHFQLRTRGRPVDPRPRLAQPPTLMASVTPAEPLLSAR